MAEQQKDNFWLYVGGLIAITVVLVIMLKNRETEHLKTNAYDEIKAEVAKQIASGK